MAFGRVAETPNHEEIAVGIADVERGQGRRVVQRLAHETKIIQALGQRTGLGDAVVTEEADRHFGRADEVGEFAEGFAADAGIQFTGGRLKSFLAVVITESADDAADQQDQRDEQGRDMNVKREAAGHGNASGGPDAECYAVNSKV